MSGKGSRLEGGALTGEVIDSSRKVLTGGRNGTGVGLQQYFTPPQVGELLAKVFNRDLPTLDLTAGEHVGAGAGIAHAGQCGDESLLQ